MTPEQRRNTSLGCITSIITMNQAAPVGGASSAPNRRSHRHGQRQEGKNIKASSCWPTSREGKTLRRADWDRVRKAGPALHRVIKKRIPVPSRWPEREAPSYHLHEQGRLPVSPVNNFQKASDPGA